MIAENSSFIEAGLAKKTLVRLTRKDILLKSPLAAVALIGGIIILILGINTVNMSNVIFGVMFMSIGVAYALFLVIAFIQAPKKTFKANESVCTEGITYNFRFKEQSIQINCKNSVKNTKFDYDYKNLKKIIEYPNMYQLKMKESIVFFVLKDGFATKEMENCFLRNTVTINKKKLIKRENNLN